MNYISNNKKRALESVGVLILIIIIMMIINFCQDKHIHFSEKSGYYEKTLELKISGGGGNRIYYTLNGDEPTLNDNLYDDKVPIVFTDATDNENVYSERTDISAAFCKALINKYSTSNRVYTVPDYNVDKCNIVRASVFNEAGECLDSITGVYFIGFQEKSGYDNIYVASIVTDSSNLFGYETGIYIMGAKFDWFVENWLGEEGNWSNPYWWWWESNYNQRGIEWEREALVTVFDENRKTILSENCGIRIQGGGSRGMLPKSIGCYARKIYGGSKFQADIFERNQYPHKFVFFSGGDDNVFKLQDYLANTLNEELSFSTMKFIPCAVFLNGEYCGGVLYN